ncbi:MAG: hypothetical protein LRY27_00485 [Chitinophagales bacterium]|nr:hypothetical protein [Chitinophagales bacterium]
MKKLLPIFLILIAAISGCKDACKDVQCVNGSCDDGTCICEAGYEGTTCDTQINDKFEGTWDMPCGGYLSAAPYFEDSIPNQSTQIVIEDAGNPSQIQVVITIPILNQDVTLVGTVDGNTVVFDQLDYVVPAGTIPQIPLPITVTFNGSGELVNDLLYIDIDLIAAGGIGTGTFNCVGTKI